MLSQEKTIRDIRDERQLKAVAGVTESQLEIIAAEFEKVEKEARSEKYEQAVKACERVRKPGGGHKGILRTSIQKVLFVLVYCKTYPTYDDLGSRFGMSKSAAFDNIHVYFPLVQKALARLGVLPHRTFHNVENFREIFSDIEEIIIDVTERHQARPKDSNRQKESYSGKKKMHTVKNTIITTMTKLILFVGQTFTGHNHDYKIFKDEFSNEEAWFEHLSVLVDLGYQGIIKDYEGENIKIPVKKPRKSKNNPNPTLTAEQKEYNKELSQIRVLVEHAIGGMKRFNILVHAFRNRKDGFIDDVIVLCAGLWNFNVIQNA
jgi:hypothetical protein